MKHSAPGGCKAAPANAPDQHRGEQPPDGAGRQGFTAWQLAEQLGARAELWA